MDPIDDIIYGRRRRNPASYDAVFDDLRRSQKRSAKERLYREKTKMRRARMRAAFPELNPGPVAHTRWMLYNVVLTVENLQAARALFAGRTSKEQRTTAIMQLAAAHMHCYGAQINALDAEDKTRADDIGVAAEVLKGARGEIAGLLQRQVELANTGRNEDDQAIEIIDQLTELLEVSVDGESITEFDEQQIEALLQELAP